MDNSKKLWLESIGAKAFLEPVKYVYTFPGYNGWFNLSEKYLDNTSLEELQETYTKNEQYVRSLLDSKNHRTVSTQMLDIFKKPFELKDKNREFGGRGGDIEMKKNEFMTVVDEIAFKYAKLVNERIDKVENGLTGEDLREVYDGIQMLGHITATMERLSRMDIPETA